MPDAAGEPVADVAFAGSWRIEPGASDGSATFALRYPPSKSNSSGPIALTELGLTTAMLVGVNPLRFELRREAGTFLCRGTVEDGRGDGAFRFTPDAAYSHAIAETGMPPLSLHQHIKAGMFDVSSSFVRAIVATGLPHVTFSQLLGLTMFHISAEDASALHADFPSADLDDIRALAMAGVTAGYMDALRRANIGALSADNVAALRAFGVDRAFVEALAANGRHGLTIDEVVSLYSNGS